MAQADSTQLYEDIRDYSQKRKVTRWIYEAIFAEPETDKKPPAPDLPSRRTHPADRFRGRTIRRVDVTITDPFGYSVDDTAKAPVAWIQRAGNALHRTTRAFVVRDLIIVHEGEKLDPLKVRESERLLRASPVVNDARITCKGIGRDSVDLLVIVHDKWNYDLFGEGDLTSLSITGRDRNFLGLGQQLEQRVEYGPDFDRIELSGNHRVYNIQNTYIGSTLQYSTTSSMDQVGLQFDRAFYSPLTRYAGSIGMSKSWNRIPILDSTGARIGTQRVDPIFTDTWVGRSFRFADDGTDPGRSTNITGAIRYFQTRYALRPPFEVDSLRINSDASTWLFAAGFGLRQYYKERYLYRFGAAEDVPEGLLLKATSGMRKTEGMRIRMYTGVEASRGRYHPHFGYANASIGYGSFWDAGASVDATLRIGLLYFSDLVSVGRWHFRQFVRGSFVAGFDKPRYNTLYFSGNELYGLSSDPVSGTHRGSIKLETVAYAPYNILGFRFAPVLLYGLGGIGNNTEALLSGRLYNAITLGLLVRNENLLVNTFEVSLSFYPYVPSEAGGLFEIGSFTDFSVNAPDLTFTRPDVIGYY
ncbi:MAG: hypothetical protein R2815_04210 [Flavobacteriales bacterium]